jgi:hypothetical protein
MTTEELRLAFARKIGLRMLLEPNQLRKTIQNGVQTGVWIYYDAGEQFGYDRKSPPPVFQISDTAILYAPDEAARLQIRIKGKWERENPKDPKTAKDAEDVKCPVCGRLERECICGIDKDDKKIPAKLVGQGAVAQAFQKIVDECQEYKLARVRQLFITVDGIGKQGAADARALGLALPQFGKGRFGVALEMLATFGKGANAESFRQEFRGGWDRFKRVKNLADAFAQEADELKITMRVAAEFDDGLQVDGAQFQTMRDALAALEIGKVTVEAIPLIVVSG